MTILSAKDVDFPITVSVAIVGAGACGLTAALAAGDAGAGVLIVERDPMPAGSTALSSGLIPAAGTRFQSALRIDDTAALMADDIQAKARGDADPDIVDCVAREAGPSLEWLADRHGLEWVVLDDFLYPGHSRHRMHAVPEKTGSALIGRLLGAAQAAGIDILSNAQVVALYADETNGQIAGLRIERPKGETEDIGCEAVILACNGYGGDPEMVRAHIPEMAEADYFGHTGNQGDAVKWGMALGAAAQHLSACQGHGSVATPHGILITWALMMEGGIQVNLEGNRFSNEHQGYSEQAVDVLKQPSGTVWNIFDARLHELGLSFDDYRNAEKQGAVRSAQSLQELSRITGLPLEALKASVRETADEKTDRFGRDFSKTSALASPYYAVKVTGALFHTQGGLCIDRNARVLRENTTPMPNLFAGGGAACGVSGPRIDGYLSGNGLLTAVTLGRIAGQKAAELVSQN
ncbi:FAD-dependent oxidoreductase [Pelagibius sp. Alg239-R121]|uniref:FAD-dependent oxidoreductase n=1 Tax=Pelagibius sp. Alg239-R121 TaxID=2993448 RepID=UPI0024A6FCAB|nr:FAD-dependent oxidoreductase [Pelagibius sp. Alg239-R121]